MELFCFDLLVVQVSKFLERVLLNDYIPNDHWLSPLRIGDGRAVYQSQGDEYFTFRFEDKTGRFSKFLSDQGYKPLNIPVKGNVFHIGVYASHGEIGSSLYFTHRQYEKVSKLRISISAATKHR